MEGKHQTEKRSTAFTVELFIIFLLLLLVIVVITQTFVGMRSRSAEAKRLTEAVICAQNAAEVISSAGSSEEAKELLAGMDDVSIPEGGDDAAYIMTLKDEAGREDSYLLRVIFSEEEGDGGSFLESSIEVYDESGERLIYTLDTGNYLGEEGL